MTKHRIDAVDAARGLAVFAMIGYHFTWDLWSFGLVDVDLFGDPLWLSARTAILSSFLLLSGLSLVMASADGVDLRRFLRRIGILVLAAGAVSGASMAMFPESPIFFGVLHHIAAASLLALPFLRLAPALTLAAAAAVFVAGDHLSAPLFNHVAFRWLGLMTYAPQSNDYVPIFPWFGVVLAGIAAGRWWRREDRVANWRAEKAADRLFVRIGRNSLLIYLLHQPILYGGLWAALTLAGMTGLSEPMDVKQFIGSCQANCERTGAPAATCLRSCRCSADRLQAEDLWLPLTRTGLTPDQSNRVGAIVRGCL